MTATADAVCAAGVASRPGKMARLLGVRSDEIDRVRGLFRASFLLGLALVLFYGSGNAIFLTSYDITVLPWVYIANAVAVIAVGLGYGAWSARVPVARALVGLATTITISVALLWGWASVSDSSIVAFLLAMWFRLLFIFAVLGLWEIASAVFDIRQAKRLFPAVALGMMTAFVVGGATTPLLSSLLGTVNLVGIAAVFFALYTLDFRRLLHRYQVGTRHDAESVAPAGPREILADRYSRRMVWMKTVTILLMYVTEYVFYEQASSTFHSEASLAGFLGVFMGTMTIVMVLVTGLLSGRYISRFGIRISTLTLPAGMLIVAAIAGTYGTAVGVDTAFFVLVCIALASNHVLSNAIGEPASAVLFQPMPQGGRMRVRLAVHGWLGSVALVFSGFLLLALNALDLPSVAPLLFLVAAIAVAGIVVAILQYRDDVDALHNVTTLGFAADDSTSALDLLDSAFLADGLGSDDPSSSLATAAMVTKFEADPLRPLLPTLLEHRSARVVDLALRDAGRSEDPSLAGAVEQVVNRSDLPSPTRARALAVLATLDAPRATALTATVFSGEARVVALGAALRDPALMTAAREFLESLAASDLLDDRVAACRAIESSGADARDSEHETLLIGVLRDPRDEVVDAAQDAAMHRVSLAIAVELVRCAAAPSNRGRAFRALATADGELHGVLDVALATLPEEAAADLIGRVIGARLDADEVRSRCLHPGAPSTIRRAGYDSLGARAATSGTAKAARISAVRDCLDADLATLHDVVTAHRDVGEHEPVVRDALHEEFDLVRHSILGALTVEYDRRRVRDIEALIRNGNDYERANAIEALEMLLAVDQRRTIVAALEPIDIDEAASALGGPAAAAGRPDGGADVLHRLADDPRLTSWTRRVVADRLSRPEQPPGGSTVDPTIARVLALRRVDIFSTLSYETLVELADLVVTRTVPAGATIIDAGGLGDELFAIVSGGVDVYRSDGAVRRLDEGTVFGELAILDPAPRSARVVARTDVELLVVARATILALSDRRPVVMAEIARVLAKRFRTIPAVPA